MHTTSNVKLGKNDVIDIPDELFVSPWCKKKSRDCFSLLSIGHSKFKLKASDDYHDRDTQRISQLSKAL